jgi:hypothetical protein
MYPFATGIATPTIVIASTTDGIATGSSTVEVSHEDYSIGKLLAMPTKQHHFLYGTIVLSSNQTRDSYTTISYKTILKFSLNKYDRPSIVLNEYEDQTNGSKMSFALSPGDLLLGKDRDVYISVYIISGSLDVTTVTFSFTISCIEVPYVEPSVLEYEQNGQTDAYPSTHMTTHQSVMHTLGKSYIFLPESLEMSSLKGEFPLNYSDYKVQIQVDIKIDREEYSSDDHLDLNLGDRLASESLGDEQYFSFTFKRVTYNNILALILKYQGEAASMEIVGVSVVFPSVYDASLQDEMIRMPSDYVIISFIAVIFSCFGLACIYMVYRVKHDQFMEKF